MLKTSSASTTEKLGGHLSPNPPTFKYPGRESLTVDKLLQAKPNLRGLFVYDVCLTNGSLLYSSAGGIGVTKEPYIVEMHKFIKSSAAVHALKSAFEKEFSSQFTKRKFYALRERMNEGGMESDSLDTWAKLYLLWCGSGFRHRYRGRGYDGLYQPTSLNYEALTTASRQSREKNLLFRKEDFYSLSESIINENVVVYLYVPSEFGAYGAGFKWSKERLSYYVRMINEFHELGHKVCVSAMFEKRGRVFREYSSLFPNFDHLVAQGVKVSELTSESDFSEIHFFNF